MECTICGSCNEPITNGVRSIDPKNRISVCGVCRKSVDATISGKNRGPYVVDDNQPIAIAVEPRG